MSSKKDDRTNSIDTRSQGDDNNNENLLDGVNLDEVEIDEETLLALLAEQAEEEGTEDEAELLRFPLSFSQERLWFLYQLEGANATYNLPMALRIEGPLDVALLQDCFCALLQRHEILRSRFVVEHGQVWQSPIDEDDWHLPIFRYRNSSKISNSESKDNSDSFEQFVQQQVLAEVTAPFYLQNESLFRVKLLAHDDEHFVLLINLHHIIADGWSVTLLANELMQLYRQGLKSNLNPNKILPPLDIQFADFADWQRREFTDEKLKSELDFWKAALQANEDLQLPKLNKHAPLSEKGNSHHFTIPKDFVSGIKHYFKQQQVSLFSGLLSVFGLLMGRVANQNQFSIGIPVSGRDRPELESLVGFFVNTLAVPFDVAQNDSFLNYLVKQNRSYSDCLAHQTLPFERLVEELNIDRSGYNTPLFQVMFSLQSGLEIDQGRAEFQLDGLTIKGFDLPTVAAKFDITLNLSEQNGNLQGQLNYRKEHFSEEFIPQLADAYQFLLQQIVEKRDCHLGQLRLVNDQAYLHQSSKLKGKAVPLEASHWLEYVNHVAKTSPNQIAVVQGDKQCSYSELLSLATVLAGEIKQLVSSVESLKEGDLHKELIAILMNQSIENVMGILAVHLAGYAYVPIDPKLPEDRIHYILKDTHARICLCHEETRHQGAIDSKSGSLEVINVDSQVLFQKSQQPDLADSLLSSMDKLSLSSNQLAYVVYTSGSTGKPKGVEIEFEGLNNLIQWQKKQYQLNGTTHFSLISGVGFDAAVWELFPSLVSGATVHVVPDHVRADTKAYFHWCCENHITHGYVPTPLLEALLKEQFDWSQSSFKAMLTGGEQLTLRPDEKFPVQIFNHYGPTEYSVVTTAAKVAPAKGGALKEATLENLPDIGSPIWNTELFILDEFLNPVLDGVEGELCITGKGLARGYLNLEEQSRDSFIQWQEPGTHRTLTLYKTGDLVRLLPNGHVDYLGRKDNQVKIRGFRIELSEIEAVLNQQEEIQDSVAMARNDLLADANVLVGYYVRVPSRQQDHLKESEMSRLLDRILHKQLPSYMCPSVLVELEALPLTANGKIDYRALPKPELVSHHEFLAPEGPIEIKLAEIWQRLLGLPQVSRDQNFLMSGGHSLLATQLMNQVEETFSVKPSLKAFFAQPTLMSLASQIVESPKTRQLNITPSLVGDEPYPLSFAQNRLWFLHQLEPNSTAMNMPIAIQLNAVLDQNALENSFKDLISRHRILTARVIETEEAGGSIKPQLVNEPENHFRLDIHLASLSDDETRRLSENNRRARFDLREGQLFRASYHIDEQENRSLLLVVMHHFISDGWSINVMLKELVLGYQAHLSGYQPNYPQLEHQYGDYTLWQKSYLSGNELNERLAFWLSELENAPANSPLMVDKPREQAFLHIAKQHRLSVDLSLAAKIDFLCSDLGVTPFTFFLAAYQLLLSKWSGQQDICVGIPTSGRPLNSLQNLIGLFVNGVMVRSKLHDNPSIREWLPALNDKVQRALEYQDIPAELLLERVRTQREMTQLPGTQVTFAFQNIGSESTETLLKDLLHGLSAELINEGAQHAKQDLSLIVYPWHQGYQITLDYDSDLYIEETMIAMGEQYLSLLRVLVDQSHSPVNALSPINTAALAEYAKPNETLLPLSSIQRDLVLDSYFEPQSHRSSIGFMVEFKVPLDRDVYLKTLQHLAEQIDLLRSSFQSIDVNGSEIFYRRVMNDYEVSCPSYDWRDKKISVDELQEYFESRVYRPFVIDADEPLLRYEIYQLGDEHFVWLFSVHHALLDGVSLVLHAFYTGQIYEALLAGQPLPSIQDSYRAFVAKDRLECDRQATLQFWREQLNNIEPLHFALPKMATFDSEKVSGKSGKVVKELELNSKHWQQVKRYCRQHRITPALYFKCIYAIVLKQYCQPEKDFVLFELSANRDKLQQFALGCFYQQIPSLFTMENLAGDSRFEDLLKAARAFQKKSKTHQNISIIEQAKLIDMDRVVFMYNYNPFIQLLSFKGEQYHNTGFSPDVEQQVQFLIKVVEERVHFELRYYREFFADLDLLNRVVALSEQLVQQDCKLAEINFLLPWEMETLQVASHGDRRPLSDELVGHHSTDHLHNWLVHSFEQWQNSTAVVVTEGKGIKEEISYHQLWCEAARFRSLFESMELKQGDKIGLAIAPGKHYMALWLACVLSRLTYVPIDPSYPTERKRHIAEDAQLATLILQKPLSENADQNLFGPTKIITLDALSTVSTHHNSQFESFYYLDRSESVRADEETLYLIYTSGTTGLPKGAGVTQVNELNLLRWYVSEMGFSPAQRTLLMSALGFDLTQKNLFAPLLTGGVLVINSNEYYDPQDLAEVWQEHQIQHINCAPSAFYPMLDLMEERQNWQPLDSLKRVVLGGEPINMKQLAVIPKTLSDQLAIYNSYGPTECTDIALYHRLVMGEGGWESIAPLGNPNWNVDLRVADSNGNPLPPGITGELWISGLGIGTGYWNKPDLNHSAFVDVDGGTWYRTGDYVYLGEDGLYYYRERKDFQIKIRGRRIELAEIEQCLLASNEVESCLVTQQKEIEGEGEGLVAFSILTLEARQLLTRSGNQNREDKQRELLERLRVQLPSFMVPESLLILDAWPLNANGKIDRKQLPHTQSQGEEYHPPETETEKWLAELWGEVLNLDRVSVTANFFELGGHSLLATQLVSRVRQYKQIELPIRDLFQNPTVRAIAELIDGKSDHTHTRLPPIVEVTSQFEKDEQQRIRVPASYSQERLWFLHQLNPTSTAFHMPVAVKLIGDVDLTALSEAFEEIQRRQAVLRTTFKELDGKPYQIISPQPLTHLELLYCESNLAESDINQLVKSFLAQGFDLQNGPLIRTKVLVLNESNNQKELVFIGCMHHIISDGWSLSVLFRELMVLYLSFKEGLSSPLPPLAIQYSDFSVWQHQVLDKGVIDHQIKFWQDYLQGALEKIPLPTKSGVQVTLNDPGAIYDFKIESELLTQLNSLARKQGVTLYMLLLGAFQILLSKVSGKNDIVIGTPNAGRHQMETEQLIGFFINALVIRHQFSRNVSIDQFYNQLKEQVLNAFAHQETPAHFIIEALHKHRTNVAMPGTQIGFALQNNEQVQVSTEQFGLTVESLPLQAPSAKSELGLVAAERNGQLHCVFEYNQKLFEADVVQTLANQYRFVLEQLVNQPEITLDSIQLVAKEEVYSLLGEDPSYTEIFPLTAKQRDMYLDSLVSSHYGQNCTGFHCSITQDLDLDCFAKTVQYFVDSCKVLRARIVTSDNPYLDMAYQAFDRDKQANYRFEDLTSQQLSDEEMEKRLHRVVYRPWPFNQALTEFVLLKQAEGRFYFVATAHHMLVDGIGFGIMADLLLKVYCAFRDGETLPIIQDHFDRYIIESRRSTDANEVLDYWKKQLCHVETLDFSVPHKEVSWADTREKDDQGETTHIIQKRYDAELWSDIKSYCRKQRLTPALFFKALYALLIKQYCRAETDFTLLEFLSGREKEHLNTIGCYFQTIPFLVPVDTLVPGQSINALLEHARHFRRATGNFESLSDLARNELVSQSRLVFSYNFLNFIPDLELDGKTVPLHHYSPNVRGPVELVVETVEGGQLNTKLTYLPSLFADLGFLDRLQDLCRQLLSGKERLADLSLLLAHEAELEKQRFNASIHSDQKRAMISRLFSQSEQTVVDLFEAQVEKSPNDIALIKGDQKLSYQKLNNKVNQLAHYLIQQGVGRGDSIGICLDRGVDMLVAVLATIKTSAAYIPMDAQYPAERLRYLLNDANATLLLTQQCVADRLGEQQNTIIALDKLDSELSGLPVTNLPEKPSPDDLIYIIYTSGSTGQPKGAGVYHRGENNLQNWYCNELQLGGQHKALLVSAFGFDLTQKNLFASLISGGTLVIPEQDHYDPEEIIQLVKVHQITTINCAPSAFYPVVETLEEKINEAGINDHAYIELRSLQHIILGGEAIQVQRLMAWLSHANCYCRVMNSYGPTECTDVVAFHWLDIERDAQWIPIGKGIDQVQLQVSNDYQQALPPGLVGELCVAGICVGSGYLNRPELTQTSFVPNCMGDGVMYKTGDLARLDESGSIEYMGRKDFQIKLRGQRIELGEIESALKQLPGVKDGLVQLVNDQLIAYVVHQKEFDGQQWKQELQNHLPNYMVPSALVELGEWPLTPNGKIDRKALPTDIQTLQAEYVAPQSEVEKELASIWQEVLSDSLKGRPVGLLDDFFELGGHSLLATQLMSRVRKNFGIDIPLRELFQHSTLMGFAEYMQTLSADSNNQLPAITAHPISGPMPLSFAQERLWFMEQLAPGSRAYHMPAAIRLAGEVDLSLLDEAFQTLQKRHAILRTTFVEEEGKPLQTVHEEPLTRLKQVDFSHVEEKSLESELKIYIQAYFTQAFDLQNGPLIRAEVLLLPEKEGKPRYVFLGCMHHIISDGWSLGVMLKELVTFYLAEKQGFVPPLAPLEIQYSDYAIWQREVFTESELKRQLGFWTDYLRHAPHKILLPVKENVIATPLDPGALVEFSFDAKITSRLKLYARSKQISLYMLLLGIFQILLSRYSGRTDLCISTPNAGRHQLETESLIGFFINALVIRHQFNAKDPVDQFFASLKEKVLDVFAHQEVPAHLIVEALNRERGEAALPGSQISFALQNNKEVDLGQLEWSGLEAEALELETQPAKSELGLVLAERKDKLVGVFEYNQRLFDPHVVEQLANDYQRLVNGLLSGDVHYLHELKLFSDQRLIEELGFTPDQVESISPCLGLQKELLLDGEINPNSLQESIGYVMELPDQAEPSTIEAMIRHVHENSPAARCRFIKGTENHHDYAYQVQFSPLASQAPSIEWLDYSDRNISFSQIEGEVHKLAGEQIYVPLSGFNDPLIHHIVIQLNDHKRIMVVRCHHSLNDGVGIMVHGSRLYHSLFAILDGKTPESFDDHFVKVLPELCKEEDRSDSVEQWKKLFEHQQALDQQIPNPISSLLKQQQITRQLSGEHYQRVKQFTRAQKITPVLYFKCLYAWMVQQKHAHKGDFVLWDLDAGRQKQDASSLGCYLNYAPVAFDADWFVQQVDFKELLKQARRRQKETKSFGQLSFSSLNGLLPESRVRYFYNYQHFLLAEFKYAGKTLEYRGLISDVRDAVQLVVQEKSDHFDLNFLAYPDVMTDFQFLDRLISLSESLLDRFAENSSQPLLLSTPPLFLDTENTPYSHKGMKGEIQDFQIDRGLHHYVEQAVEKYADQPAVWDQGGSISYGQLNKAANTLAKRLIEQGLATQEPVAIYCQRGREMAVGILAVLKANGMYLPVDASYPQERVQYMLENSGARVVLTQSALLDEANWEPPSHFWPIDIEIFSTEETPNPNLPISPDQGAYLLYTSGSTGQPKGTIIPHKGAINHILAEFVALEALQQVNQATSQFEFQPFHFLQTAPASSDISVWQFLAPLFTGGKVVVVEDVLDSPLLFELMVEHQVNLVELVPAALNLLLDRIQTLSLTAEELQQKLAGLKYMMATGENVPVDLVNRWLTLPVDVPVINAYGPTEASDDVCQSEIQRCLPVTQKWVPIGTPLANTQVVLVNQWMQVVPRGWPGEMLILGDGLAQAYWQLPEKTAQAFIQLDIEGESRRAYRTGDLGVFWYDDQFYCLGRIDEQVQLRGYRVELGEIENQLMAYFGIAEAAVTIRVERLVAYYIAAHDLQDELNEGVLTQHLLKTLPKPLIPSYFVQLDELPLTPAGKIDRKQLPEPSFEHLGRAEYVVPESDLEKQLALIWEEVLGVEKIGLNDEFFLLGGHSLLAPQVVAKIKKQWHMDIPIRQLFETPSLSQFAAAVQRVLEHGDEWSHWVDIQSKGDNTPIVALHPISGEVFGYYELSASLGMKQPFFGIQLTDLSSSAVAVESLDELLSIYEQEIESHLPKGPICLMGHSIGGVLAWLLVDRLENIGYQVEKLFLLDSFTPDQILLIDDELSAVKALLGNQFPILEQLGGDQPFDALYQMALQAGVVPPGLTLEVVKQRVEIMKRLSNWVHEAKLNSVDCTAYHFAATDNNVNRSRAGWDVLGVSEQHCFEVSGNHETILKKPGVQQLSDMIAKLLSSGAENS